MTIKPSDKPIPSSGHRCKPWGCDLCHQDVGSGSYGSFRARFGLFALFMELFLAFFVFVAASIVQVCARSATAFVLMLFKKRTHKGQDLWFSQQNMYWCDMNSSGSYHVVYWCMTKKNHFIRSLLCELRTPMICPHHHSHRAQAFSHEHGAMVPLAKYWKVLGDEMVSSTITNNCLPPAISDAIKVLLWELKHLFFIHIREYKIAGMIYLCPPSCFS